jgi:FkbM family methyltransferase
VPPPEIPPEYVPDYQRLQELSRRRFAPTSVLDVGASTGVWTTTCAAVFPNAEYFLIEPQVYPDWRQIPEGLRHSWIREAVGKEEREVELIVPEGKHSLFNAHIFTRHLSQNPEAARLQVPQTTVDRLLETGAISPPQLVKLDVQGYELEVMAGATKIWESARVFFVEASLYRYWEGGPVLSELIASFAARGFQPYEFSTEHREPTSGLLSQVDLIFVHESCEVTRLMDGVSWPFWDRRD